MEEMRIKLVERSEDLEPDPAPDAMSRVARYEELEGAVGRAVFFRPQRYTAADLAPLRGTLTMLLEGELRICPVLDVSQNGAAISWANGNPPRKGKWVSARLKFDGHEAFRGHVRIGSVRESGETAVVGLTFDNFLLDVDDILSLRSLRAWAEGMAASG